MTRIGLVSDTHDLLRPVAKQFLQGCDLIVHAGDICGLSVLSELETLAPVTAVRGNNDKGAWAEHLLESEFVKVGEILIYVIHDLSQIDIDLAGAGVQVVVSGHSHQPHIERRGTVLFVNPGSAGPRRFKLPISIGELEVDGNSVEARTTELAAR